MAVKKSLIKWTLISSALLVGLFILLLLLIDQIEIPLPEATGRYQVAYQQYDLEPIAAPQANDNLVITIDAWYPTAQTQGKKLTATPLWLAQAVSRSYGMPESSLIDDRELNVLAGAEPLEGQHATLIFNHGHNSFARQNQSDFIELASQGFIILAINHPGYSLISHSQQGKLITQNTLFTLSEPRIREITLGYQQKFESIRQNNTYQQWQTVIRDLEANEFAEIHSEYPAWMANNDQLMAAIAQKSLPISENIDLQRIGAFGHSFGGAVSSHLALKYPLIKAAINLDGPVFSGALEYQFDTPICFAYSNESQNLGITFDFSWVHQQVAKKTRGCEARFEGAAHMNFADLNAIWPLKYIGILGSIDNQVMAQNQKTLLLGFFNQHLNNQPFVPELPFV